MSIRAKSSFNYKWRLALIGIVCLGFGIYCIYDGFYAYPAQRVRANKFLEMKDAGRTDEWPDYARSQGWSIEDPGSPKSDFSIYAQYIMAAITLPIGLLFGVSYLRYMNRWVEADDNGIRTSTGQDVPWDDVTGIDTARWKAKGIAMVQYTHGEGTPDTILLDDWKFERDETVAIYKQVAEHLGIETDEEEAEDESFGNAASTSGDTAAETEDKQA